MMPLPRISSLIQIRTNSKVELQKTAKPKAMNTAQTNAQLVNAALESFFLTLNSSGYELNSEKFWKVMLSGLYCEERRFLTHPEYWHKIVIVGGSKYYKDYVLKLIIGAVHPHDLIPVKYLKHETDTCFFVRECVSAIEKLCRNDLKIENPHGESIQLRIIIAAKSLGDVPINTQVLISKTILKRYNPDTKSLNLSDFHNDPDFKDMIFCPLSQPRILFYILSQINPRKLQFENVSLANNELTTLKSLDTLNSFKALTSLDLSRNKILLFEELNVLKSISLRALILDNNPLCQNFEEEVGYIQRLREIIPTLEKLDGVVLRAEGIPRPRRNFLSSPKAGPLADQFIDHYFHLYDGVNRRKLYGMYHNKARFSMTCTYIPGQSTSSAANLTNYMVESRNLLKLSDYSKTHHLLHQGQDEIVKLLCKLPKTDHDQFSFSVDVPLHNEKSACLHIGGVFREPNGLLRTFSRIFYLVCILPEEWQIVNEMLHISNARTEDEKRSFKIERPVRVPRVITITDSDKAEMTNILIHLTDLKEEWAKKCLDDMNWEFKDAIQVFIELYKLGKIPRTAFVGM